MDTYIIPAEASVKDAEFLGKNGKNIKAASLILRFLRKFAWHLGYTNSE